MIHNLLAAHRLTGEGGFLDTAIGALGSLSAAVAASPLGAANATRALLRTLGLEREIKGRLSAMGPAPQETDVPREDFSPVEVYASAERISVGNDRPAELQLVVRIKDGYHINAADPGPGGSGLVPLRVGVVHGTGIAAYADYPAGEKYGAKGELLVHTGSVEFRVAVDRVGEWTGRPLLSVTYQACTDTECLAPRTVELDVSIDQGGLTEIK
jgi:hypothetical protein